MQSYKHITLEERENLQVYLLEGKRQEQIARLMNRSPSTISRELSRNRSKDGNYTPMTATKRYIHRRKNSRRKYRLEKDEALLAFVAEGLRKRWPPEAIVAKWKEQRAGEKLSVMTLYLALKRGLLKGFSVKEHLPRRGKRRYKRGISATIQPDKTIEDRCREANHRLRIGDWEGDTILGPKKKSFLVTCVDRKSRYTVAAISASGSAQHVFQALVKAMTGMPAMTLTLDNGPEFAKFRELERALNIQVYFAHPRSPWERGTNENMNGKLRYFFPKDTDFSNVSSQELSTVLDLLNSRPRKCLNWLSPADGFFAHHCT